MMTVDQYRQAVLSCIAAFCAENSMSETAFGRWATSDPSLVERLRNGNPTLKKLKRIEQKMEKANAARQEKSC